MRERRQIETEPSDPQQLRIDENIGGRNSATKGKGTIAAGKYGVQQAQIADQHGVDKALRLLVKASPSCAKCARTDRRIAPGRVMGWI